MSKSDNFENRLLLLLFNAVALAGLAEDHSAPVQLELSLHTANPGEAGDQTTTEATYTGYARITAARTAGVWTVTGNRVENVGALAWPQCTAGSNTITHWAVGLVGDDEILYYGALTAPAVIDAGETPQFPAGSLTIDED
jgi:hypothetical protein